MKLASCLLLTVGAACLCTASATGAPPAFHIGFHTISSGGNTLRNTCFHIQGTLAQTAPGYSSGDVYALMAGYWQFVPPANPDEIFNNSFEDC